MDLSSYFGSNKVVEKSAESEYEQAVVLGQQTSCVPFFDQLMYCYSPANQVSTYYYTGSIDPCQESQSNFFKCLKLKTNKSLQEKEKILKEIQRKEDESPTAGVWTFKEDPSQTWNPAN